MRNPISHIGKLLLIFLLTSFLLSGCSVGSHAPSDMGPINPAPIIIPEIVNWKGSTGHTNISELTYIVCPDEELKEIAETLQKDILVITGINLQIIYTQQKSADHAIILQIQDKKLLPEEYILDIGLDILISGADTNAIFWGTECKYSYAEFTDNISLITNIPGASYLLPSSSPQKNVLTPPYSVSFDVNLESLEEITLFENKAPYGTHSVAIKQDEQGFYLSCSTEYREYYTDTESGQIHYLDDTSFHLTITADMGEIKVYMDEDTIIDEGENSPFLQHATFLFPMEIKNDVISNLIIL